MLAEQIPPDRVTQQQQILRSVVGVVVILFLCHTMGVWWSLTALPLIFMLSSPAQVRLLPAPAAHPLQKAAWYAYWVIFGIGLGLGLAHVFGLGAFVVIPLFCHFLSRMLGWRKESLGSLS